MVAACADGCWHGWQLVLMAAVLMAAHAQEVMMVAGVGGADCEWHCCDDIHIYIYM